MRWSQSSRHQDHEQAKHDQNDAFDQERYPMFANSLRNYLLEFIQVASISHNFAPTAPALRIEQLM